MAEAPKKRSGSAAAGAGGPKATRPAAGFDLRAVVASIARDLTDVALAVEASEEGERSALRIRSASVRLAFAVQAFDERNQKTLIFVESERLAGMPEHAVSSLTIELGDVFETGGAEASRP